MPEQVSNLGRQRYCWFSRSAAAKQQEKLFFGLKSFIFERMLEAGINPWEPGIDGEIKCLQEGRYLDVV